MKRAAIFAALALALLLAGGCGERPGGRLELQLFALRAGEAGVEVPWFFQMRDPESFRGELEEAESLRRQWTGLLRLESLELLELSSPELGGAGDGPVWSAEAAGLSLRLERPSLVDGALELDFVGRDGEGVERREQLRLRPGERLGAGTRAPGAEDGLLLSLRWRPVGAPDAPENAAAVPPEDAFGAIERAPVPVGGLAALARRLRYPSAALADGASGTVLVAARVDTAGIVRETRLTRGVHAALDSAALAALVGAPFLPGLDSSGRPREVWISLPVRYALSDGPRKDPERP